MRSPRYLPHFGGKAGERQGVDWFNVAPATSVDNHDCVTDAATAAGWACDHGIAFRFVVHRAGGC